jgi:hypothetical protein
MDFLKVVYFNPNNINWGPCPPPPPQKKKPF